MNSEQFHPECLECKFFPCSSHNECSIETLNVFDFKSICIDHDFDWLGVCRCGLEDPQWEPPIQEHF